MSGNHFKRPTESLSRRHASCTRFKDFPVGTGSLPTEILPSHRLVYHPRLRQGSGHDHVVLRYLSLFDSNDKVKKFKRLGSHHCQPFRCRTAHPRRLSYPMTTRHCVARSVPSLGVVAAPPLHCSHRIISLFEQCVFQARIFCLSASSYLYAAIKNRPPKVNSQYTSRTQELQLDHLTDIDLVQLASMTERPSCTCHVQVLCIHSCRSPSRLTMRPFNGYMVM